MHLRAAGVAPTGASSPVRYYRKISPTFSKLSVHSPDLAKIARAREVDCLSHLVNCVHKQLGASTAPALLLLPSPPVEPSSAGQRCSPLLCLWGDHLLCILAHIPALSWQPGPQMAQPCFHKDSGRRNHLFLYVCYLDHVFHFPRDIDDQGDTTIKAKNSMTWGIMSL